MKNDTRIKITWPKGAVANIFGWIGTAAVVGVFYFLFRDLWVNSPDPVGDLKQILPGVLIWSAIIFAACWLAAYIITRGGGRGHAP